MNAVLMKDYQDRIVKPGLETYSDLSPKTSLPSELPLFEFEAEGKLHRLRRPIALRIGFEGDTYFVENESLSIFGHGPSLRDAVADFLHDLAYLWSRYRSMGEHEVAGRGRELKTLLRSLAE